MPNDRGRPLGNLNVSDGPLLDEDGEKDGNWDDVMSCIAMFRLEAIVKLRTGRGEDMVDDGDI